MSPFTIITGFVLAFAIGFGCRWLKIPPPAPASLTGALLVVTITLGYLGASWWFGAV